jgi:hypothetical protein
VFGVTASESISMKVVARSILYVVPTAP